MCLTHVVCYSSNTPMHYISAAQTQRQTNRRNQYDHLNRHNLAQRFGCRHGHNGSHRTQLSQTFQPLPPPPKSSSLQKHKRNTTMITIAITAWLSLLGAGLASMAAAERA
ncbi:hypothetical protein MCERH10_00112 [Caulobacteraceae bacterium]